jgi:hypothetical protein
VPHRPQELGTPEQDGSEAEALPGIEEAKVENFLLSFFEPHSGHSVPFQSLERTKISLSLLHCSQ